MSREISRSTTLSGGEFYGKLADKKQVAALTLSELSHKKKIDLPAHSHDLASFSLLLDGNYTETYRGKTYSYDPMTVWWHPPETFHKDEVGEKGGRFFVVEIQTNILENLSQIGNSPTMFYDKSPALTKLATRLYNEFRNWQVCSELLAMSLTLEMLAYSMRKSITVDKTPPVWLSRVVDKLNDQFAENITAEELALEADVHPVHLAAVFRKFHHQTIGEYVQNLRIQSASRLLIDKDLPISEIALLTGFSDQSHLTRTFKRVTGTTPGVFRKNLP